MVGAERRLAQRRARGEGEGEVRVRRARVRVRGARVREVREVRVRGG